MNNISSPFENPALPGLVLIIPFLILELVNRRNINEDFPFLLFVFLWFLPTAFVLILTPLVRDVHAGNNLLTKPINLVVNICLLVLIATIWGGIVVD